MLILNNPLLTSKISDPDLRALVERRFSELTEEEPYDPSTCGYFVLVEPGDTVSDLEAAIGWPVLGSAYSDKRFGDAGFYPGFELLEEHSCPACYEIVFVVGDDGYGFIVFVPKGLVGVSPELTSFCAYYAAASSEVFE